MLKLFLFLALAGKFSFSNILYSAPAAPRSSLILFVHGLGGNEKDTWTNSNFYFPEQVYQDTKNRDYDVFVFNYNSTCNNKTTSELSSELRLAVNNLQKKYQSLVIIGHSYGGIIAKQFILKNDSEVPKYNIKILITLSTPNFGSNLASFYDIICNGQRVNDLESGRGKFLDSQNESWVAKYQQKNGSNLNYFSAYEILKTHVQNTPFGELIVDKNSAVLFAQKTACFATDHYGTAKPKNKSDTLYSWVSQSIFNTDALPITAGLNFEIQKRVYEVYAQIDNLKKSEYKKIAYNYLNNNISLEASKPISNKLKFLITGLKYDLLNDQKNAMLSYAEAIGKYSESDPAIKNILSLLNEKKITQNYNFKSIQDIQKELASTTLNFNKFAPVLKNNKDLINFISGPM